MNVANLSTYSARYGRKVCKESGAWGICIVLDLNLLGFLVLQLEVFQQGIKIILSSLHFGKFQCRFAIMAVVVYYNPLTVLSIGEWAW